MTNQQSCDPLIQRPIITYLYSCDSRYRVSGISYKNINPEMESFLVFAMFGKIYKITPDPKGFTWLILTSKQPYETLFRKFTLWSVSKVKKRLGDGFIEGSSVRFEEDTEAEFPSLTDIELCELVVCFTCHAFYELGDAQRLDCGRCTEAEPRKRVDIPLKLVVSKEKKYTWSPGLTLTFKNDEDDTFSTCVFSRSPLFEELKTLSTDSTYKVFGWVKDEKDRGLEGIKSIIELDDVPELDD